MYAASPLVSTEQQKDCSTVIVLQQRSSAGQCVHAYSMIKDIKVRLQVAGDTFS